MVCGERPNFPEGVAATFIGLHEEYRKPFRLECSRKKFHVWLFSIASLS